jgi:protein-L-isoaspartate(D-aspartate) O-methyltransferase
MELPREKDKLLKSLGRHIASEAVLKAMAEVPRQLFVPAESRHLAYRDIALSIGEGQTISQPYIVAMMTQALELEGGERVLEIGTGSGYQAAVLSRMLLEGHLFTVEIVPVLAERARALLQTLGYDNITVELAGETLGAPHHGPFDAIIVTAAAPNLPPSLTSQLAMGGRMVIPIGSLVNQELIQARRTEEGLSIRCLENCRFVPLIGREGFLGVEQAGAGAPKLDLDLLDSDPQSVQ